MGIKRARKKPLQRYTTDELGIDITAQQSVRRLYQPQQAKQPCLGGWQPRGGRGLLNKLRFEARVL